MVGDAVRGRIEIVDVAEDVAGRIADAAIGLGDLLEDRITDAGVVAVVLGGRPRGAGSRRRTV